MIMKANKQIGLIYKSEESIDKILKDGKVVFERGFLREKTSTTLPITFGGVGKDLKDYKIYGNTVQSKLPTGYIQVDYIESSGAQYIDTGIAPNPNMNIKYKTLAQVGTLLGVNKGDYQYTIVGSNYEYFRIFSTNGQTLNSLISYNNTEVYEAEILPTKLIYNNSEYSFSNQEIETYINSIYLFCRNLDGVPSNFGTRKLYYFKIYDNNVLVRDFVPCYRNSDNEVGLYDLVNNVFYTNQGTGSFTYGSVAPTPDAPIDMVSVGDLIADTSDINYGKYKIPVNVRSENLINNTLQSQIKNGITLTKNRDGSITANGTATANTFFDVGNFVQKQNVAYTLNGCPNGGGNSKYRLYILGEATPYFDNGNGVNFPIVNTDTQRTLRLAIYNNMTVENLTFYPMIRLTETGNVKYQPYYNETTNIYLDEPLRRIDGYSDYIDFANGKIVRNIDEIILNGNESWDLQKNIGGLGITRFRLTDKLINSLNISSREPIISDYFFDISNGGSHKIGGGFIATQYLYLYFGYDGVSLTDFTTWLQSNNVTVNYVLATPTEESITLPNIPTTDGNNTLNIETEITPSQVYIKYKSNT